MMRHSTSTTSGNSGCWWVGSSQKPFAAASECGLTVSRIATPPGARREWASSRKRSSSRVGQVLDDLRRDHGAQRRGLALGEERVQLGLGHVVALGPGRRDHARVEVDAERLDAVLAQQVEELAATAAEVEDRLVPGTRST